jgi:hypothetical protein
VLHRHLNKLALRYRIGRLVSPHTQVPRLSPCRPIESTHVNVRGSDAVQNRHGPYASNGGGHRRRHGGPGIASPAVTFLFPCRPLASVAVVARQMHPVFNFRVPLLPSAIQVIPNTTERSSSSSPKHERAALLQPIAGKRHCLCLTDCTQGKEEEPEMGANRVMLAG